MSELKVDPAMNEYCFHYLEYKLGLRNDKPEMKFDKSLEWYKII